MTDPETLAYRHARAFADDMRAWSAQEIETLLSSPHVHHIGNEHAFAITRVVADEAEILTLATDPEHRRQGLARTLLETLESHARKQKATCVFLEVSETNTAARALYFAAGYAQTARRKAYYTSSDGQRSDALILTKTL